jgi:hypothetical protein
MSNDPKKFKTGIAVTGSATVGGDTVTTNTVSQTLTNKTIDADSNTISNIDNADIKVGAAIDAAKIHDGSVSNTEFGYLDGVTSSIQTQLTNNSTGLSDHLSDTVDAHDASAISNIPSGNLSATDVQSALNELQSDVDSRALDSAVIKKNGSVAFTSDQSMGGFKLTSLASPTSGSDAANKSYVDAVAEGLKPKTAARVATTANIVIATALNSGDIIDGVTLANGDRVLVKDQSAAEQNGIYIVSATPSRSTDFDSLSPIDEINGALVAVQEGTVNAGKVFVQQGTVSVLDTDPINFVFFNSSASLVGGDGITVSGNNVSVDHDGEGLQFVSTQLALELDGSTLSKSASGVKVATGGITNTEVNSSAAIAYSKLNLSNSIVNADISSSGTVSNTEFGYLDGVTSAIQTQLDNKASTALDNLGTTSINADLLPSVDVTRSIGSSSARFLNSYTKNLRYGAAGPRIDMSTGEMYDTSNNLSADFGVKELSSGGILKLGWSGPGLSLYTGGNTDLILDPGGTGAVNVSSSKITNVTNPTSAQDAATKSYVDGLITSVTGDISQTSFSAANNQASAVDVTGLAFANASVRSFRALVSVSISATSNLFESFELLGVQRGSDWAMSVESVGDASGISFSITTAGQVQYTSSNVSGFVSNTMKFRAIVTSV